MDVFIEWFERVYKHAPNTLEDELEQQSPDAALVEAMGAELADHLDLFERLLDGRDHLLGAEFSAADCVAYPFLKYAAGRDPADTELFHEVLERYQPLGSEHPRLADWIERVGERPRAY